MKNENEKNVKEETLEEVSGGLPYMMDPRDRDKNEDLPVHHGVSPNSIVPVPVAKKG